MLEYETILVKKADLETLISKVEQMQKEFSEFKKQRIISTKVGAYSKGGFLSSSGICKIMNWSTRTFYRRIEAGEIPIIKEANSRYVMSTDTFLKWYDENFV